MIATFWLVSILSTTMMREIECMYEEPLSLPTDLQQHQHRFANINSELYKMGQPSNRFELEKRTKPSLSITNPLDVLRQRLMLEIARRQMREKSNQVEINREHLTRVGKRVRGMRLEDRSPYAGQLQLQELLQTAQQHSVGSPEQPQSLDVGSAGDDDDKATSQERPADDENALNQKYRNALQFYRV